MENEYSLFMVLIGCTPQGRLTEQHDIFFGIGTSLRDLVPQMKAFWPEANGKIHIDAWRKVNYVADYHISVTSGKREAKEQQLFFINLGGYKPGEFEEYHYKILEVASGMGEAVKKAKSSLFYQHFDFPGAESHVDDKYGIDVDDAHNVNDILDNKYKEHYQLHIEKTTNPMTDELHIGYVKLDKLL